jgi:hypothetical protein
MIMSQTTKARRSFDRSLERNIRVESPVATTFKPEAGRVVRWIVRRQLMVAAMAWSGA